MKLYRMSAVVLTAAVILAGCATPNSSLRFDYQVSNRNNTGLIRAFEHNQNTVLQFIDLKKADPIIYDDMGKRIDYSRIGQYAVLPGLYKSVLVRVNGATATVTLNRTEQTSITPALFSTSQPSELEKTRAELNQTKAELAALKEQIANKRIQKDLSHYSQVKTQVRGNSITVMRAPFAYGSKDFMPSDDLKNALLPAAQKASSIRLRGRTDSDLADYINARIAQQRALSVKQFLIQNGIDPKKIHVYSTAAGNFIADNSTEVGKAQNRRVDIELVGVN